MFEASAEPKKLLQVGEFAKRVGKTVRAMHLYEELGLLTPVDRSKGGFRLYDETSIERARWIVKLQGIGFTLAQIQGFVADFDKAANGRVENSQARVALSHKLSEVKAQATKLRQNEAVLVEALNYLDGPNHYARALSPANLEQQLHVAHGSASVSEEPSEHENHRDSSVTSASFEAYATR